MNTLDIPKLKISYVTIMKFKIKNLRLSLLSFFIILIISLKAQVPSGYIADWKNDANAAYSIVHDDYGLAGCDGIWQYGDTIAYNRGIKFVFGAYTDLCETRYIKPNGYDNLYDYAKNVMIAQHGHEIANHSSSHACATDKGWSPCLFGWGESGWGEAPLGPDLDVEINEAHNSIVNGTGFVPKYYVYPYDAFTNATNQRLEDLGYIGSRTGWSSSYTSDEGYHRNGYENSDEADFFPNSNGFFRNGVQVFNDDDAEMGWEAQLSELNNEIDNIIANNLYANREFHNVGNSGWGHVKVEAYRAHMDYLKLKVDEGKLWVGTVSEIFTYQIQKLKYSANINYVSESDRIYITWNTIGSEYDVDVESYLSDLVIKTPITLVVNLDGLVGSYFVSQNSVDLNTDNYYVNEGKMYINVYPHDGDVQIYKKSVDGNNYPYVTSPIENKNLVVNFTPFTIDLNAVFEDTETIDEDFVFSASGYSGISIDLSHGIATISAPLNWIGNTTVTFSAEDEGGLSISESFDISVEDPFSSQTPFSGVPISIPGRVEAEDYDEGDEGDAYNEEYSPYEPDPTADQYRPWDPVDVDIIGGTSEYGVGYTVSGEWLEYTVNVTVDAWYTVDLKVASVDYGGSTLGKIKLLIDGNSWMPATDMIFTGGWTNYETVSYPYSLFLEEGTHVLRVSFVNGDVNLNYIDILASPTTIKNNELRSIFEIYPNPASDFIKIKSEYQTAKIYSQMGELVKTSSEKNINLTDLASGIYFVKLDESSLMVKFVLNK